MYLDRVKSIGYHTRLRSDPAKKVVGGSFGGQIDMETVNRLTRMFTVIVKPSGACVFVDSQGREVHLYLSVDPDKTEIGIAALKAYREQKAQEEREADRLREEQWDEINDLMASLSHDEIVRRLKGEM